MRILSRIGVVLAVSVAAAIGQPNGVGSVKMGNLTWTKENVNINTPNSWCYRDSAHYCEKYGRLYTWEAAKQVCRSMGGGWRLPTREDWDDLASYVGGVDVAGIKLKSKSRFGDHGTDNYGFSAMPGGFRSVDGKFYMASILGNWSCTGGSWDGDTGLWWSAEDHGANNAYVRHMKTCYGNVSEFNRNKADGLSVRCSKD